jgi:hypothetical protein
MRPDAAEIDSLSIFPLNIHNLPLAPEKRSKIRKSSPDSYTQRYIRPVSSKPAAKPRVAVRAALSLRRVFF